MLLINAIASDFLKPAKFKIPKTGKLMFPLMSTKYDCNMGAEYIWSLPGAAYDTKGKLNGATARGSMPETVIDNISPAQIIDS